MKNSKTNYVSIGDVPIGGFIGNTPHGGGFIGDTPSGGVGEFPVGGYVGHTHGGGGISA